MTPDAALDQLAFVVGLRLMGPDAVRKLRIALTKHPDCTNSYGFQLDDAERLEALIDGRRPPLSLQDRIDIANAESQRHAPPFDPSFWALRRADLIAAGFEPERATALIEDLQRQVDPTFEEAQNV